jgi:dTDP-4-dehydrorhamnose reductase
VRVLVTGAAGMLGRDLLAHLAARGDDPVGVDMEVDIRDPAAVGACLDRVRPDAVIHCAAWTDVDGAEGAEDAALAVNGAGAGNVAAAAARHGVPLVQVSTDYVFDGTSADDYAEDAPTAPIGAYGRTKLAGELAVLAAHPGGARIARTAWLYGAGGRNFVDTMRRVGAERDEVTVVDDQLGCPTWARDLAPALRDLLELPPGIYHTAGAGSVTWAGFAREIFRLGGIPCRVLPITTQELGRPAPRPARSVLAVTRPDAPRLRDWREALADYIAEAT